MTNVLHLVLTAAAPCPDDRHLAVRTPTRDGDWHWTCRHCPAIRRRGNPTWSAR